MGKIFLLILITGISLTIKAQHFKKDGTPDMRYKENKESYGNYYQTPSNSNYYNSSPQFSQPQKERNYENGGEYRLQNGYYRSNGTYVEPHLKTSPDNYKHNNKNYWD